MVQSLPIKAYRQTRELSVLHQTALILGESLDVHDTLSEVFALLAEQMGLERICLTLWDAEARLARHAHSLGLSEEEAKRAVYRLGEGLTGRVIETKEAAVVADIYQDPRFLNRTRSRKGGRPIAFICVPVTVHNKILGALSCDRVEGLHPELQEDVRLLTIIASLVGQAVALAQKVERERQQLQEENRRLREQLPQRFSLPNFVGQSKKMEQVKRLIARVAGSDSTVLLLGESGTGKELVARTIHFTSARKNQPFVKVDCGTLPENLVESELFGYEKGAFTGATGMKKGKMEEAEGGTIFLDEIGNLPLVSQAKLLRFLQERVVERLGGNRPRAVDVRVIVATNEELEKLIQEGRFRQDLYFRLNVLPIFLPSLRERGEDLPLLVRFFVQERVRKGAKRLEFSTRAWELLAAYPFPGNVRELQNIIERLYVLKETPEVTEEDLAEILPDLLRASGYSWEQREDLPGKKELLEKEMILQALNECGSVKTKAAQKLGISERMLRYKIKKYGIGVAS